MSCLNFYEEEEVDLFFDDLEIVVEKGKDLSANDAFLISMNVKGCVNLEFMSEISGMSTDDLIDELKGKAIWPQPEIYEQTGDYQGCFTTREQYLRGNLIRKYRKAKKINEKYGLFDETVKLLKEALPDMVEPEDIHMNLASTWIPVKYIIGFVQELLGMIAPPRIEYNEYLGKWTLEKNIEPNYVKNFYEYGTHRMNAFMIIKHILNAKPVKVYDQVAKTDSRNGYESVLNKAETLAAQQKEKLILEKWQDYVHGNSHIEQHLQEVYMESYGYAICKYDGSYLQLPGLNPNVKLYPHQMNAIARIVLNHNVLLAHEVGAGKSYEFMCGVHELIRLNLGKKAMIVLPNNTFEQAVRTYKELYEKDNVFAVYPKKSFTPTQREATIKKIKSDKYQVIFMAYSSFDMLSLSAEYAFQKKEQQILVCKNEIANVKNLATKRALEVELKNQKRALEKFKEEFDYSETACFDKLGVDILVVDEAHNYKNISLDNKTDNIVGVHNAGSKKADNMLEKVEYIQSIDGHVIFATGTPITNSMADLYVFQRYLQPMELKLCNVNHFNDWISTFCSQTHTFEVDVDSKNYRFTTRFSKFHNLPELMSMFSDVCDFYRVSYGELDLPEFAGYSNVLVKKSEPQREYIDRLAERTEDIRAHKVKRNKDNLLLITVHGRMCALDVRLVLPDVAITGIETKVSVCANQMAKMYHDCPGTTQIAFSDNSTPKEGFNIYDELKEELMKLGIPAHEIAYIHDASTEAQRNKMEKQFNNGDIRILIGSTTKLGTGANVQERLIAVHHLDVPWRPADMVQREGRIIRQGNTNSQVYIYRYCTEASFDAYTWQILENKQRFIAQFLSGSLSSVHRDESDCADTVLNYAEIKALAIGNPLIKERVEVSNELEHAKINQRQKRKELGNLQELLDTLPNQIKKKKMFISRVKADNRVYKSEKKSVSREDREMFGEELLYALAGNEMLEKDRLFDTYQEFDVILPKHMKADKPYIILQREGSNTYTVNMDGDKPMGCSMRIDYFLEHLEETVAFHEQLLEELYKQKKNAEASISKGNEFDVEVERLVKKLEELDKRLELKEEEVS